MSVPKLIYYRMKQDFGPSVSKICGVGGLCQPDADGAITYHHDTTVKALQAERDVMTDRISELEGAFINILDGPMSKNAIYEIVTDALFEIENLTLEHTDRPPLPDDGKDYWAECPVCGRHVHCGKCGNNCCNGGTGTLPDGSECGCDSAYTMQDKGEGGMAGIQAMGQAYDNDIHVNKEDAWDALTRIPPKVKKDMDALQADLDRTRQAIRNVIEGNIPVEIGKHFNADKSYSKHDRCKHDMPVYNDCVSCIDEYLQSVLPRETT